MSNLLYALHSLLEDILDLGNDLNRIVIVDRDQLVRLSDQVELEKGLRVLVSAELSVDLSLNLLGQVELIILDHKIAVRLFIVEVRLALVTRSLLLGELVLHC